MQPKTTTRLATVGLWLTAAIWGFAFVIVKNSLDFIPPLYMIALRFTLAGAVLGLIIHKRLRHLTLADVKGGAVVGLFLFLAYITQTIGCQYTTAGKNAFLTAVYMILVPFLNWPVNHKRPGVRAIVAAAIGFAGIGLLSLGGDAVGGTALGDGLTLLCGLGFAVHIVSVAKYTEHTDPVVLTFLQLSFTALFAWILAPLTEGSFPIASLSLDGIIAIAYLGLLSSLMGFLLQNVCQKIIVPSTVSLILSFEAVFGVLFSILFLGDPLTLRLGAGFALMFIAVIIVEMRR